MADKAVFCIATSEAQALRIVEDARVAGFSGNDISVLFPDKQGTRDFAHEKHTKAPEGAAAGATTGGVLGGVAGWLVGIGALAIPGLGPGPNASHRSSPSFFFALLFRRSCSSALEPKTFRTPAKPRRPN